MRASRKVGRPGCLIGPHFHPSGTIGLDPGSTWGLASAGVESGKDKKALVTPLRLFLVILLLTLGVVAAWFAFQHRSELGEWAHAVTAWIREHGPVPFFTGLALLPAFGLPVTAFYLASGAVFPLWISLVGTAAGLAVNIAISYWMARKWFRHLIEKMLRRTRYSIPAVAATDHVRLTLFLRLMPGPPFFVQSYILGMVEVPFPTYFFISWGTQILIASGFIILGSAFYSSDFGRVLIGIVLVVLLTIIVQWVRRLLARRASHRDETT